MIFTNPILLCGVAAGVIPLVLHLLSRSRYRTIEFSAMMFINGGETRHDDRSRLKQWLLLLIRTAIICLLALALAQPVLQGKGAPAIHPPRAAAVILLDRSASMALNDNGRSRLDMAREAVFQILPGLHRGDDAWLVPMGEPIPGRSLYTTDPQDIWRRVRELNPPAGQADVGAALNQALSFLEGAGPARGEIYIVCDQQAVGWRGVDSKSIAAFQSRAARLPFSPRIFVVPVGTAEHDNVSIESVEFARLPVVADQTVDVEIRLRNSAAAPRAAVQVALRHGKDRVSMPINLPAGGAATARLPVTFTESGPQVISAEVDAPGLAFDKSYPVAVDVMRDLRVLIIDGDEHDGAFRSESDFLRLALAPYRARRKDAAVVEVISPNEWAATELSTYNAVILTNVPQFSESQASALEQYVYDGGGLLVAPGDRSRAENYNERLYRYGDGILPAEIQPALPESVATTTSLNQLDLSHPVFSFLRNRPDSSPPAVIRRYFPVTPRDYGVTTLASYLDGRPFLLESRPGRGRVLLMTTSVDIDWNTLALTNFFLPFAQSMVRFLADARPALLNVFTGEALVVQTNESIDPKLLVMQLPDKSYLDASSLQITQDDSHLSVRFTSTLAEGVYRLYRKKSDQKLLAVFAVNTPRSESDLTPLSREAWRTLEKGLGVSRLEPDRGAIAAAQDLARTGWNLWLPLLGGVTVLSLAELALARRWSRVGP